MIRSDSNPARSVNVRLMMSIAVGLLWPVIGWAGPLTPAFTYQARLTDSGVSVNGQVDLIFTLYDADTLGNVVGAPVLFNGQGGNGAPVDVVDGVFTTTPDFGAGVFDGSALWMEIQVRSPHDPTDSASYTVLNPRQPITSAPYAQKALTVAGIDGHSLDAADGAPADAVYVNNVGLVGIGTNTPASTLHVVTASDPEIRIENSGAGSAGVLFTASDYEYEWRMTIANSMSLFDNVAGIARMSILPTGEVGFAKTNPTNPLSVGGNADFDGFVGIGTAQPQTPLSILSNGATFPVGITQNALGGAATMELTTTDTANNQATRILLRGGSGGDTADIEFYTGASGAETQTMIVDGATGNVGIGTPNPMSKLSISNGGDQVGITQGVISTNAMELTTDDGTGNQATRIAISGNTISADVRFYDGASGAEVEYARFDNTGSGGFMELTDAAGQDQIRLGCSSNGGELIVRDTTGLLVAKVESTSDGGQIYVRDSSGTKQVEMYVDSNGEGRMATDVLQINGGADIAEPFNINTDDAEIAAIRPGMVVSIDPRNVGDLRLATSAYDRTVAGIISGAGGVKPGMTLQQTGTLADGKHPVALTGRVWCFVDADRGAVVPGDMLTTSDTPGHAMKVGDHGLAQGAIIGKAMTSLESGRGLVMVLVTLQ